MKALVVLAQAPRHEGGAPGKCAVGLLRGLAGHGVEVRAVAAVPAGRVPADVSPDLDVELVEVPPRTGGPGAQLRRLRRPRGDLATGPFARRVRELGRDADVVHLDQTDTAALAGVVDAPCVLHVHYRALLDRPLARPWGRESLDVLEFARAERRAIDGRARLVASSPVVAESIRRDRPGAEVTLMPLSLDPAHYEAAPVPAPGPPTLGIIGTASWPVTARALRRLVADVWPRIRAEAPAARLAVAGRDLATAGLVPGDGVELVGEVASAVDFLHGLTALVYPLEYGSGMKVKVLEALACGVPVVTTRAGAEGVEPGDGVVVAEDDAALAAAAVGLLRDAGEQRERAAAARESFLSRYAPAPATRPLVELYGRLATA